GDPRDAVDSDWDGQPDYLDAPAAVATDGVVATEQKISDTVGSLTTVLDDSDYFGRSTASIGDLDGDGIVDVAVGAHRDDDGGSDRGAVYVLFLNADGTVKAEQKISSTTGSLTGPLDNSDNFGQSVAGIGDLDGDGIADIAVGAIYDDDGGSDRGAVYVLFLNADGTVKAEQKISSTTGGLTGPLDNSDQFGTSVAGVGDLDGDGIVDIAVGAYGDDDGGSDRGAVYVLFLNADGTVKAEQKVSSTAGSLTGPLDDSDWFGRSVAGVGDLDGDGIVDVAVGAYRDDDGGSDRGAVYVLFLNADGTVKAEQKISSATGGLTGPLDNSDYFGTSAAGVGDLDGDGIVDVAVGALFDDDGGSARGAAYVLFLNADGTVKAEQRISSTTGGLTGPLDDSDQFGISVAGIGDLDGDGTIGLMAGAFNDDDGGTDRGAVYVLDLSCADSDSDGLCDLEEDANTDLDGDPATTPGPDTDGDLTPNYLDNDDDGDGTLTSAENADPNADGDPRDALDSDWDGEPDYLDLPITVASDGTVATEQKISDTAGGLAAVLDDDRFGASTASIGDLDGDGIVDIAVGAYADDDGGTNRGAVYVLFLNADGTVKAEQKISSTTGGLTGPLDDSDELGWSVAGVGDLDGDGIVDIAVGAYFDDDGGSDRGAVYVLFLNADGTVKAEQKISSTTGGLTGPLDDSDVFGRSVAGVGDLDNDGIADIAVGAPTDDDGGSGRGAVYVLFLNADGTVKAEQKISSTTGGLTGPLDDGDQFGLSVAGVGDLDGDGIVDVAVGAIYDDDGGTDRGAAYVLFLNADGTVKAEQKISSTVGGVTGPLDDSDLFGTSVVGIGDVDGDGTFDVAVGASRDDDGGTDQGAVHVLFLNADGTVKAEQKISSTTGGLTGPLDDQDYFGQSVAGVGDLDADGIVDIAVGARFDDDGGSARGAVYVLDLAVPVVDHCAVDSDSDGLWDCEEDANTDLDGDPATTPGPDTDGDTTPNYLDNDDDGDGTLTSAENADPNADGDPRDALDSDWDGQPDYLDLPITVATDGRVATEQKISDTVGGLTAVLDNSDGFGSSAASIG
ncbi:MAG: hypothetical protein GY929_13045, partial [Actinomycetia bacterium]|nr:hypothetical protein [Actinomycetes bacterium]